MNAFTLQKQDVIISIHPKNFYVSVFNLFQAVQNLLPGVVSFSKHAYPPDECYTGFHKWKIVSWVLKLSKYLFSSTGLYIENIIYYIMETVSINKQAIIDLMRVKDEFDTIVESIELMGNKKFMESYKKAKEQVKKREFVDWDVL